MTSPLFITAREYICYATEFFFLGTQNAEAKYVARKTQLGLTPLPSRAQHYTDNIDTILRKVDRSAAALWDFEVNMKSFAAYVAVELEKE